MSTRHQEDSGLGLEAQRRAVRRYAASAGYELVEEVTEIASGGTLAGRPKLLALVAKTISAGLEVLVAKLDRLARDLLDMLLLERQGLRYIAVDMPGAPTLLRQVSMAFNQEERARISRNTKEALEARRARVGEWRVSNLDQEARDKGGATMAARAREHNRQATAYAQELRARELSYAKIAAKLKENGYRGQRGGYYSPAAVKRILDRAPANE